MGSTLAKKRRDRPSAEEEAAGSVPSRNYDQRLKGCAWTRTPSSLSWYGLEIGTVSCHCVISFSIETSDACIRVQAPPTWRHHQSHEVDSWYCCFLLSLPEGSTSSLSLWEKTWQNFAIQVSKCFMNKFNAQVGTSDSSVSSRVRFFSVWWCGPTFLQAWWIIQMKSSVQCKGHLWAFCQCIPRNYRFGPCHWRPPKVSHEVPNRALPCLTQRHWRKVHGNS